MYFLTFDGKILSLLLLYESVTPAKDNTLLRKRGEKNRKNTVKVQMKNVKTKKNT